MAAPLPSDAAFWLKAASSGSCPACCPACSASAAASSRRPPSACSSADRPSSAVAHAAARHHPDGDHRRVELHPPRARRRRAAGVRIGVWGGAFAVARGVRSRASSAAARCSSSPPVIIAYMAVDMALLALRPSAEERRSRGAPSRRKQRCARPGEPRRALRPTPRRIRSRRAWSTGLYSGLLGLGGGFVIVPVLTRWLGFPAKRAIGTSLVAIAILSIPATVTHAFLGHIDWRHRPRAVGHRRARRAHRRARSRRAASERAVRIGFARPPGRGRRRAGGQRARGVRPMSGILRPAQRPDLAWLWPAVRTAQIFDSTAELEAFWSEAPWRVRVNARGEAAVLVRWREHLDMLAIKGLWCSERRVPLLLEDLRAVARAQGFGRLLSPLLPDGGRAAVRGRRDAGRAGDHRAAARRARDDTACSRRRTRSRPCASVRSPTSRPCSPWTTRRSRRSGATTVRC